MHSKEAIQWINENIEMVDYEIFKKILIDCLGVKKDEEILILGDVGTKENKVSAMISAGYYYACNELGIECKLVLQKPKYKGDKADEDVIEALYKLRPGSVIILALSSRIGSIKKVSRSFRNYTMENKHRFASATNLGQLKEENYHEIINAIDVDYKQMQEKGEKIKEILDNGKFMHITTESGTDLRVGIEGCKAIVNAGDYKLLGKGGNMPAGEVYLPPKWKEINGVVVIDGSSAYRFGTQLIKEPIKVEIKKGEIASIKGGEEAKKLKESIDWAYNKAKNPWGVKRVGEIGIGINPNAKILGATIIDEKTIGTAHIAFGSNYWFGGTILAIIHFDQIFKNPKILVDGVELKV